jgi:4-aminobutyrate aminotransferase-like enzyme
MLEAFQGWGSLFYPDNYIKCLLKFAKKNNILVTMDEMQSGFARTGKKFAFEHYNFTPDIICCGKGMGSGMPLSGVITSGRIMDIPGGNLQSTHSANPLSCAAGIAVIDEIKNKKLVSKSRIHGDYFLKGLKKLQNDFPDIIGYALGKGLVLALIMKKYKNLSPTAVADFICHECYKNNILLVNTGRESIKFGPPLVINKNALKFTLKAIRKSLEKIKKKHENKKR